MLSLMGCWNQLYHRHCTKQELGAVWSIFTLLVLHKTETRSCVIHCHTLGFAFQSLLSRFLSLRGTHCASHLTSRMKLRCWRLPLATLDLCEQRLFLHSHLEKGLQNTNSIMLLQYLKHDSDFPGVFQQRGDCRSCLSSSKSSLRL